MPLDLDNSKGELVIDPYRHKERYKNWDKRIATLSSSNEQIIIKYLEDMRQGININPKARKGKRGYNRLNNQRHRLKKILELLERHFDIKRIALNSSQEATQVEGRIRMLFEKMEEGEIKKINGKRYLSVRDYIKGFKAFWHWYIVYMKKEKDVLLPDITEYLTVKEDRKPKFVYFGEVGSVSVEQAFKKLINHTKPHYKPHLAFLFDSGIRCPTEFMNIKRKDIAFIKDSSYFWLNIRDETSKTFGRRIKLMLCHELLQEYLEEHKFEQEDFIFKISPRVFNQYLTRLGERVLGKSGITMYDFRHNSACYYLPRYKSENGLMYRYGWKDSKEVSYYTSYLGMRDTIHSDDLLVDVSKNDLERELENEKRQRVMLSDELTDMKKQMQDINRSMNQLTSDPETVDFFARKAKLKGVHF